MPNRNTDSGLALSRTCKQLREECGTRLYSKCIIYITVFQGSKEEAKINYIRIKEEAKIDYIRIMRKILPLLELLDLSHSCDTVIEEVEQLPRTDYHQQEDFAVALWLPRVCEGVRAAEARKWATGKKATALVEWMVGSVKGCKVESKAENKAVISRKVGGDEAVDGKVPGSMASRVSKKRTINGGEVAEPSSLALWFAMCKWALESW
ncbi:hypothetical protein LTR27_011208 [Elasticomyces elasticus]|nr:hypothetical protein LTR27_011208 [Elasticomyces elasticus]